MPSKKRYMVSYKSKNFPIKIGRRFVRAPSKKWISDHWHEIMETDEYTIVKTEEVK